MQKIVHFLPKNEENNQLFDEFFGKKGAALCFITYAGLIARVSIMLPLNKHHSEAIY